jgi:hypothetical protein
VIAVGRCDSWPDRREAKIVPKIATPKEPPTERKKVAVDVATPISCGRTSFWTTRTSTCMTSPIPTPTTSMYSEASQGAVPTPRRESRYMPQTSTAVPAIGNAL